MATTAEIVSATSAVVSAIGGAFAAWAAFRSADSARVAQQAAKDTEHSASLRQIAVTASEVIIEAQRVDSRGGDLKRAYRTLFAFAGANSNSRLERYDVAIDEKIKIAANIKHHAKLFTSWPGSLEKAPSEEFDRVQILLSTNLNELGALREGIEREFSSVEGQSSTYRDKVIRGNE